MPCWSDDEGRYSWRIPGGHWYDTYEIPHPPIGRNDGCKCIACRYSAITDRIERFSNRAMTPYNQRILAKAHQQFRELAGEVKKHYPWITLQLPERSRDVTAIEIDEMLRGLSQIR